MEDERIVLLYWDRDEAAISESSMKYGAYCTSIAQNILKNPADAEECVNDTWLHAWNAMPPHRPSLLSTFLGKITRNLSFDLYRKMHRGKRGGSQVDAVLDELEECVSGGEVLLEGEAYMNLKGSEKRRFRRNIQMVFQDPLSSFSPRMKVGTYLMESRRNFDEIGRASCRERV